jgi:FkbM family methyltransferase
MISQIKKVYRDLRRSRYLKKMERAFDPSIDLYYFEKDGYQFYSNTFSHFNSLYNKIFGMGIYRFHTETDSPFIIDCGANIGMGVCFWKKMHPNSEIVAFEPDPEVFRALAKNVEPFSNVKIIDKALSDKVGKVGFTSNSKLSGSLNMSKNLEKNFEVDTILLSEYLDRKVDFLKIDIEGEEVKVLQEIQSKLYFVENIFIEYHSFLNQEQELSIILKLLEKNGFRYHLESETKNTSPLIGVKVSLNQDLQVNIWGRKKK